MTDCPLCLNDTEPNHKYCTACENRLLKKKTMKPSDALPIRAIKESKVTNE